MTVYELIAKLTEKVARTPALGECAVSMSVTEKDTQIEVDFNVTCVEIEGTH